MRYVIESAMADYTGGGIYLYTGKLSYGNYFLTSDDWDCIEIVNEDPDLDDESFSTEWIEKHYVETLTGDGYEYFWNTMLNKIITDRPEGNYDADELADRLIKKYAVRVSYMDDIETSDTYFTTEFKAWEAISEAVMEEIEAASQEHDCYIEVKFDWRNRKISVRYPYNDEICVYRIEKMNTY